MAISLSEILVVWRIHGLLFKRKKKEKERKKKKVRARSYTYLKERSDLLFELHKCLVTCTEEMKCGNSRKKLIDLGSLLVLAESKLTSAKEGMFWLVWKSLVCSYMLVVCFFFFFKTFIEYKREIQFDAAVVHEWEIFDCIVFCLSCYSAPHPQKKKKKNRGSLEGFSSLHFV